MDQPVILFDGVCNLCNNSVQFIIKRDHAGRFRFASLQSAFGLATKERFDLPDDYTESFLLLENDQLYFRSSAALRVARHLTFPWWILSIFTIVPAIIRDVVYNFVARNRYRWFGKRESCTLMMPEWKNRFLT